MKCKSMLTALALCALPQLYVYAQPTQVFPLQQKTSMLKQCAIVETSAPLDFAILGEGYFVISDGKKGTAPFFTRWGGFQLNAQGDLVTSSGDYLLGMTQQSKPKSLSKINIPINLPTPQATNKVEIEVNLPAINTADDEYKVNLTVYDAMANDYAVEIQLKTIEGTEWSAEVFTQDKVSVGKGRLIFNQLGQLTAQKGLEHLAYPVDAGSTEINFDFKNSTQYEQPFNIMHLHENSYGTGGLTGITVGADGIIVLVYSNGTIRTLPQILALATFTNPKYLEKMPYSDMYKPTEKSGKPMIDWASNGRGTILQGALEEKSCLRTLD